MLRKPNDAALADGEDERFVAPTNQTAIFHLPDNHYHISHGEQNSSLGSVSNKSEGFAGGRQNCNRHTSHDQNHRNPRQRNLNYHQMKQRRNLHNFQQDLYGLEILQHHPMEQPSHLEIEGCSRSDRKMKLHPNHLYPMVMDYNSPGRCNQIQDPVKGFNAIDSLVQTIDDLPILVTIEGFRVASYFIGGEPYLCLPQLLQYLRAKFTLQRLVAKFEDSTISFSNATRKQVDGFVKASALPEDAQSCPLIRRSDADIICMGIYEQCHKGRKRDLVNICSRRVVSPRAGSPASIKSHPRLAEKDIFSEKEDKNGRHATPGGIGVAKDNTWAGYSDQAALLEELRNGDTTNQSSMEIKGEKQANDLKQLKPSANEQLKENKWHDGRKPSTIDPRSSYETEFYNDISEANDNAVVDVNINVGVGVNEAVVAQHGRAARKGPFFENEAQSSILALARAVTSTLMVRIYHRCFGKCTGLYYPSLLLDARSRCIECTICHVMFSPRRFIGHTHGQHERNVCHWGFNSYNWSSYIRLSRKQTMNNLDDDELLIQFRTLQAVARCVDGGSSVYMEDDDDDFEFDVGDDSFGAAEDSETFRRYQLESSTKKSPRPQQCISTLCSYQNLDQNHRVHRPSSQHAHISSTIAHPSRLNSVSADDLIIASAGSNRSTPIRAKQVPMPHPYPTMPIHTIASDPFHHRGVSNIDLIDMSNSQTPLISRDYHSLFEGLAPRVCNINDNSSFLDTSWPPSSCFQLGRPRVPSISAGCSSTGATIDVDTASSLNELIINRFNNPDQRREPFSQDPTREFISAQWRYYANCYDLNQSNSNYRSAIFSKPLEQAASSSSSVPAAPEGIRKNVMSSFADNLNNLITNYAGELNGPNSLHPGYQSPDCRTQMLSRILAVQEEHSNAPYNFGDNFQRRPNYPLQQYYCTQLSKHRCRLNEHQVCPQPSNKTTSTKHPHSEVDYTGQGRKNKMMKLSHQQHRSTSNCAITKPQIISDIARENDKSPAYYDKSWDGILPIPHRDSIVEAIDDLPILVTIEGFRVASYFIGGEPYLCLPQLLQYLRAKFTLQRLVAKFEDSTISFSNATRKQVDGFVKASALPEDAQSCPLIRRSDADIICMGIYEQCHKGRKRDLVNICSRRVVSPRAGSPASIKSHPRLAEKDIFSEKEDKNGRHATPGGIGVAKDNTWAGYSDQAALLEELRNGDTTNQSSMEIKGEKQANDLKQLKPSANEQLKENKWHDGRKPSTIDPRSSYETEFYNDISEANDNAVVDVNINVGVGVNEAVVAQHGRAARKGPFFENEAQSSILALARAVTSTLMVRIYHRCFGKCTGLYYPSLLLDARSRCIECTICHVMFSPRRFIGHTHGQHERNVCHWGFNSYNWSSYIRLSRKQTMNNLDDDELLIQFRTLQAVARCVDGGSSVYMEDDDDDFEFDVGDDSFGSAEDKESHIHC